MCSSPGSHPRSWVARAGGSSSPFVDNYRRWLCSYLCCQTGSFNECISKLDSFWSTFCNLCTQTYFSKGVKVRITLITDIGSTHKTFQHQHVFVTNRERGLKVSKVVTNSICQQLFLWARTFWGQGNVLVLSLERTQRRQIKEGSTHYARSETNKRLKWNLMTLAECSAWR